MLFAIICLTIGGLSISITSALLIVHQRFVGKIQGSYTFLVERNNRIASGWIPPRYQNLQTDEERDAAISELMNW